MATDSSILAWKTPWMEEHSNLQSMGSQRVGHDWVTSLHFTSLQWKNRRIEFFTSSENRMDIPRKNTWQKEVAYTCLESSVRAPNVWDQL